MRKCNPRSDSTERTLTVLYEFEFIRDAATSAFSHSRPRFNQRMSSLPPLRRGGWKSLKDPAKNMLDLHPRAYQLTETTLQRMLRYFQIKVTPERSFTAKLELLHQILSVWKNSFKAKGYTQDVCAYVIWMNQFLSSHRSTYRLWIMIKAIGQPLFRRDSFTWHAKNLRRSRRPDSFR